MRNVIMFLSNGTQVTIEGNRPDNALWMLAGASGEIIGSSGPFFFVKIDDDVYGVLEEFIQPKVTQAMFEYA